MRWVQKYISPFGGDPEKVTMWVLVSLFSNVVPTRHHNSWGESAGAMSVALQMVTNGGDTEGLFRGAFMQSGMVLPSGDVSLGQQDYDNLVQAAGCAGAKDTLECLRQVPFPTLKDAVNMSPSFLSYRVCHDSIIPLSAVYEPYFTVYERCLGPEGGWDVPQGPTATVDTPG